MDVQWVSVVLTTAAVTVSLAAFIHSEIARLRAEVQQVREEGQTLGAQLRGDIDKLSTKLSDTSERTARIEGILVTYLDSRLQSTVAQGVQDE